MHRHEPRPGKDKDLESKRRPFGMSVRQGGRDLNSALHWCLTTIFLLSPLFSGWFIVGTIYILYNNIRKVKWNGMSWETEEQKSGLIKPLSREIQREGNGRYWQPYTILRHAEWDVSGHLFNGLWISAYLVWKAPPILKAYHDCVKNLKGPCIKKIKYSINVKQFDLAQLIIYSETVTRQRICQNDAVFICIAIFIVFILVTRILHFFK
jgi:hypothetical protein